MTMDVTSRKSDIQISEDQTEINPIKVAKRPFDVAFLMLPDDKLKQKQIRKNFEKFEEIYNNNESVDEDEEIEVGNSQDYKINHHQKFFTTQKQQIFDDPNLIKAKNFDDLKHLKANLPSSSEKSAFTKVTLPAVPSPSKELRLSPNLSISPDLTYQNSLSPSPPIITRPYQPPLLSPNQLFKTQQAYQNQFLQSDSFPNQAFPTAIRPHMYTNYSYQQFPSQEMLKIAPAPEIRNPAAAILTSLLPPSLAALSLPAQNVCAKCNISFRMTSDLVYHMRSHHKNDSVDMHKRRREEKLKCPVCAESFRERHHLTRHMTAHQDKDEDEKNVKKKCV